MFTAEIHKLFNDHEKVNLMPATSPITLNNINDITATHLQRNLEKLRNLGAVKYTDDESLFMPESSPKSSIGSSLNDVFNALTASSRRAAEQKKLDRQHAYKLLLMERENINLKYKRDLAEEETKYKRGRDKLADAYAQTQHQVNQNILNDKVIISKDLPIINKYTKSINSSSSLAELRLASEGINANQQLSEKGKASLLKVVNTQRSKVFERNKENNAATALAAHQQAQRNNVLEVNKRDKEAAADKAKAKEYKAVNRLATDTYANAQDTLNTINNISEGDIENAGGGSSIGGAWLPASRGSVAKFNQILSQQFLNNISQMKGLGSMSNAEGSKVTGAATALVDPETNALKTGLPEDFIKEQLLTLKKGASNMQAISKFHQEHGREPSIEEWETLTTDNTTQPKSDSNEAQIINWSDL